MAIPEGMENNGDQTLNDKANTEANLLNIAIGVCGKNRGPHKVWAHGPASKGDKQACGLANHLILPIALCNLFRVQCHVDKTSHLATATTKGPPLLVMLPDTKSKCFPNQFELCIGSKTDFGEIKQPLSTNNLIIEEVTLATNALSWPGIMKSSKQCKIKVWRFCKSLKKELQRSCKRKASQKSGGNLKHQ